MKHEPQPIIIVDTREQRPWVFSRSAVVARGTVPSGADYTVLGYEAEIGIERKSIADLVGSLTTGRDRFLRSVRHLLTRRYRLLLVEGPYSHLEEGYYRSRATPASMTGSVCRLMTLGLPVLFVADQRQAARFAERWLRIAWASAREDNAIGCAQWLEEEDGRVVEFVGQRAGKRRAAA